MVADVDWQALRSAAAAAATNAYAPYSRLHVGAAALTESGEIVTGVNVENVSFGLTFCAEVSLVGAAVTSGAGRLVALVAADADGQELAPCGRCRQILLEVAGPNLRVNEHRSIAELLPDAFAPHDLP